MNNRRQLTVESRNDRSPEIVNSYCLKTSNAIDGNNYSWEVRRARQFDGSENGFSPHKFLFNANFNNRPPNDFRLQPSPTLFQSCWLFASIFFDFSARNINQQERADGPCNWRKFFTHKVPNNWVFSQQLIEVRMWE